MRLENGELRVFAKNSSNLLVSFHTQASLVMASFADLAEVPGEAEAFVDDTNVILLAPRPFLTRLVPLGRGEVCEVTAPFPVASLVQQLGPGHIPAGSCVSAQNERFAYLFEEAGGSVFCSTRYAGPFVVD